MKIQFLSLNKIEPHISDQDAKEEYGMYFEERVLMCKFILLKDPNDPEVLRLGLFPLKRSPATHAQNAKKFGVDQDNLDSFVGAGKVSGMVGYFSADFWSLTCDEEFGRYSPGKDEKEILELVQEFVNQKAKEWI